MRCEDNINFYLSFEKLRKNDCWSDISHSLSFSKIFSSPFKPDFTIKIAIQVAANNNHNHKLINMFKTSQLPASLQLAVSQLASRQPAASQPPASQPWQPYQV